MPKKLTQIYRDDQTDRLMLDDMPLHCGEVLRVLLPARTGGRLVEARLEYGEAWYLVGLRDVSPCGLFAETI